MSLRMLERQVAGNMDEKAPSVLDKISDERRSKFDNNLARVISKSLEKKVEVRYQTADEMHEAIYSCLVDRGEAMYRCGVYAHCSPCRKLTHIEEGACLSIRM